MAIGTPYAAGHNSGNVTSFAITTIANINAGDAIAIVHTNNSAARLITSITDSAGNSYAGFVVLFNTGNGSAEIWICESAVALASGATITVNFQGVAASHGVDALGLPGFPTGIALDIHPASTTGTATSATAISTGTLTFANELLLGIVTYNANPSTFTPGSPFSAIASSGTASQEFQRLAYTIVAATTAQSWAPTWVNSQFYRSFIISLWATNNGDARPAGVGALAGNGIHTASGAASLAGAGAIAVDSVHTAMGSALVAGSGAIGGDSVHPLADTPTLSGAGAIAANSVHTPVDAPILVGAGSLGAAAVHPLADAPILIGVGTLAGNATFWLSGSALLVAAGAVAADSVHAPADAPVLAGAGAVAADSIHTAPPSNAVLAGEGFCPTAVEEVAVVAALVLTGAGSLACDSVHPLADQPTLVGQGAIALSVVARLRLVAPLAGAGAVIANGVRDVPIFAPRDVGHAAGNAASFTITTTGAINASDLILVLRGSNAALHDIHDMADDSGNFYHPLVSLFDTASGAMEAWVCEYAAALPAGGNIVIDIGGGVTNQGFDILAVSGFKNGVGLDVHPAATGGTATSAATVATGTLSYARELVIGLCAFSAGTPGSFLPGGSFTATGGSGASGAQEYLPGGWQITTATTSIGWSPSWVNNVLYRSAVFSVWQANSSIVLPAGAGTLSSDSVHTAQGSASLVGMGAVTAAAALRLPGVVLTPMAVGQIKANALFAPVALGHRVNTSSTFLQIVTLLDINPGDTVAIFCEEEIGGALLGAYDDAGNQMPPAATLSGFASGWGYYWPQQPMAAGGNIWVQFSATPTSHSAIAVLFRQSILVRNGFTIPAGGTAASASMTLGTLSTLDGFLVGHITWGGSTPGTINDDVLTTLDQASFQPAIVAWGAPNALAGIVWSPSWQYTIGYQARFTALQPGIVLVGEGNIIALLGFAILGGEGFVACDVRHTAPASTAQMAATGALACDSQRVVSPVTMTLHGAGALVGSAIHSCADQPVLAGQGNIFAFAFGPPGRLGHGFILPGPSVITITTLLDINPGDTVLVLIAGGAISNMSDDAGNAAPSIGSNNFVRYLATSFMAAGGHITLQFTATTGQRTAVALLFPGMVLVNDSISNTATGGGLSISMPYTQTSAPDYAFCVVAYSGVPSTPITSNFVLRDNTTNGQPLYIFDLVGSQASGTFTASWSTAAGNTDRSGTLQVGQWFFGRGAILCDAVEINARANLVGTGAVLAVGGLTWKTSAAFAGHGALAGNGIATSFGATNCVGHGALAAATLYLATAPASLPGEGFATADSVHDCEAQAVLAGAAPGFCDSFVPGQIYVGPHGEGFVACDTTHFSQAKFATLAGVGFGLAAAVQWETSAATLLGGGGLSAAGVSLPAAVASLAAAGGVQAGALLAEAGAGTFTGSGALACRVNFVWPTTASLAGAGVVSAHTIGAQNASAALPGGSGMGVAGVIAALARVPVAGSGGLLAVGQRLRPATSVLAGRGGLAAAAVAGQGSLVILSGAGATACDSVHTPVVGEAIPLAGAGALITDSGPQRPATAVLAGAGSLLGTGRQVQFILITLTGAGRVSASARQLGRQVTVRLAGASGLHVDATRPLAASATLAGAGRFYHAWGFWIGLVRARLAGAGAIRASAMPAQFGSAALAGASQLYGDGIVNPWTGVCIASDATIAGVETDEDIFEVV